MLTSGGLTKTITKQLQQDINRYQKNQAKLQRALIEAPLDKLNPDLPIACVFDIDGTLAKRRGRAIFDFDKSIDDDICLRVKHILDLVSKDKKIIIVTGREEMWRDVTVRWFNKHNIHFDALFMRRNADNRPSEIIKEEIWANNIRNKYSIFFVVDDRKNDVLMYRSRGMYVFCSDNSREAPHKYN